MNINETIDRLTARINNARPAWLHLDALPTAGGPVVLTATLLHPLGTMAKDDSPEAITAALVDLFIGLAEHVAVCADELEQAERAAAPVASSTGGNATAKLYCSRARA